MTTKILSGWNVTADTKEKNCTTVTNGFHVYARATLDELARKNGHVSSKRVYVKAVNTSPLRPHLGSIL